MSFTLATTQYNIDKPPFPNYPLKNDNFYWFAFGDTPMWLDLSNPTILNLANSTWPSTAVVIPEDAPAGAWVYLMVTAPSTPPKGSPAHIGYFPVAHPVSLNRPN